MLVLLTQYRCAIKRNMSSTTILGLTAAGLLAFYFFNQSRTLGYLNYYIQGVDLGFTGITPVLRINLGIQNPSNDSFQVKSIVGNLYANNSLIGNVSAFGTLNIPAASSVVYPLYIRMSLMGVVSDIVKIFEGGGITQQIEFDGAVNVNNITAPLTFKYSIG